MAHEVILLTSQTISPEGAGLGRTVLARLRSRSAGLGLYLPIVIGPEVLLHNRNCIRKGTVLKGGKKGDERL